MRDGEEVESFDYYKHLLAKVDIGKFDYDSIEWNFHCELEQATEQFYQITLGDETTSHEGKAEFLEKDEKVKLWLVSTLGFDWLSART